MLLKKQKNKEREKLPLSKEAGVGKMDRLSIVEENKCQAAAWHIRIRAGHQIT